MNISWCKHFMGWIIHGWGGGFWMDQRREVIFCFA